MAPLVAHQDDLPAAENVDFTECYGYPAVLPTPTEVRARAEQDGGDATHIFRPKPVAFPEQRLLVKWGKYVTISEGQCLWFMGKHLREIVPVPKIYAWRRDQDQTFLYMELVEGDTLMERWDDLSEFDRIKVCEQLRESVASWRDIMQPSWESAPMLGTAASEHEEKWMLQRIWTALTSYLLDHQNKRPYAENTRLCQIGGQPLGDILFYDCLNHSAGPFSTVEGFHKYFARLLSRNSKEEDDDPRQYVDALEGLTNNVPVVFTHADLERSNILISKPGDGETRVLAIIDWHQSGWYPEPWEYLTAQTAGPRSEWVKKYLPSIVQPSDHGYMYAWEYIRMSTI